MNVTNFGTLNPSQMLRTQAGHAGSAKLISEQNAQSGEVPKKMSAFEEYLVGAMNTVNEQQLDVNRLGEQFVTNPDSVNIEEVSIAMSKAQMSLSLAQTVIDRVVTGWNELSTNR